MTEPRRPSPAQAFVHLVTPRVVSASDLTILDVDERARFDRYRNRRHAAEFAAGRIELRRVLADCLGRSPDQLDLSSQPNQKPFLTDGTVEFSVAHRNGVVAIALAATPLGVDLEGGRRPTETEAVYSNALTTAERHRIDALTEAQRHDELLAVWVRKEAILKRLGAGLRIPPSTIETPDMVETSGTLVSAAEQVCRLWDLKVGKSMVGAVATAPTIAEIVVFDRLDER